VWLSIKGTRVSGQGAANENLKVLLPLLASDCPGIEKCYPGTINVQLELPLQKKLADKWTQRTWDPVFALPPNRDEGFGFIEISFECPSGSQPRQAWILLSEGAPLTYDPFCAEIVAPDLRPLPPDTPCVIHLARLPTQQAPKWFGRYRWRFQEPQDYLIARELSEFAAQLSELAARLR
jgi:hypothetical protein